VAVVRSGLDGIILPKVESAAGLATIDWLLAQLQRDRELPSSGIDLIPIIETARGLDRLGAILAAGTRIRRVAFGADDFTLDLNIAWSRGEAELAHARAAIVTASRIEAPLDTVWVDLTDGDGLEASARTTLGFDFQGTRRQVHRLSDRLRGAAGAAADRRDPGAGERMMTGKPGGPPTGPLSGVTVLDLCSYLDDPYGCTLLADLGADVIKIEAPQGDMLRQFPSSLPGESHFFLRTNRGKRALALDLKQPEGLAVLHRMVASADALVGNFQHFGAGPAWDRLPQLRALNPRLVYAELTGYGDEGPLIDKGGFDQVL
jgi:hypothetical protein